MTTGATPIKYEWNKGARISIAPEVAGREFERIAKRDQEVTPATVVRESTDPTAPLHSWFEWDDSAAAEEHRISQARQLIRTLHVVYVRNDTEEPLPPVRAYVSVIDKPPLDMDVRQPTTRSYQPIAKVVSSEDLRDQYRRQAFSTLCLWRDRYQDIEEFTRIFREIDTLKERYTA